MEKNSKMADEFHNLEESLKSYLTEGAVDSYNKLSSGASYRYNNLKFYMEPSKSKAPHFIVRIGMSEAMFDIESINKISGGLGPDERNVRRWAERHASRDELSALWTAANKTQTIDTANHG